MQSERPHLMFKEPSLVRPLGNFPAAGSAEQIPPMHRFKHYWQCALDSGKCQKPSTRTEQFEPRSVFQQTFSDILIKDNGERSGFLLFLASRCSNAVFRHYVREIRVYLRGLMDSKPMTVTAQTPSQLSRGDATASCSYYEPEHLSYTVALIDAIEQEFYEDYLSSTYHRHFQREVLCNGMYTLKDFLFHEQPLRHLREFLEHEQMQNVLLFWLAADSFRRCVLNRTYDSTSDIRSDALSIYQKFIALDSPYYLGFDEAMRASIEYRICPSNEDELVDGGCFDQPCCVAYKAMDELFQNNFRNSIMFVSLLSELTPPIGSPSAKAPSKNSMHPLSTGRLDPLGRFVRPLWGLVPFSIAASVFTAEASQSEQQREASEFAQSFIDDVVFRNTSWMVSTELGTTRQR